VHFGNRLIVEVDGGQHDGSGTDAIRDRWLEQQGFRVYAYPVDSGRYHH